MASALDFMLAARRSEMQGLRSLELTCELVGCIGRLIHALQRERGFSNIYLGSHEERYRAGLDELTADSQCMQQRVVDCFARIDRESGCGADKARLFNHIAYVLHYFESFAELRRRIRCQQILPMDATRAFSRPISGLLNVVFEAADTAVDPQITRHLVALFNFMQGKELAGQERAAGVAGFTLGYFDSAAQAYLGFLEDAQKRCFEIFNDYAEPGLRKLWSRLCADQLVVELAKLRQIALRSSQEAPIASPLAEIWFELASRRIDVMKQLEDQMTEHLHSQCQRKIIQAQADLDNHRALLKRLTQLDDDAALPAARVFNLQASDLDTAAVDSLGGQLNRSVMDVLHAQSQRLQALGVELEEARRSLNERKLIDRAKGLLMKQHGLTEDAAYRMLQNAAMERSQRLADVAQHLLNYAELLQGKAKV
ncbi:nitrate regulatory protein [Halopseudomonas pelagia]|uniref:nitrate regulatory protein n=1 Tax=Halopseudomonas pelagia TaxID=553151 RepID=UPI0003A123DD|nr:nitrate regulatory protein [Halopseudomonas pelagia]|tara:strand:- start:152527 stop:153804 length:1278 start_codon:yes stop_codon:yes gene_type:complete